MRIAAPLLALFLLAGCQAPAPGDPGGGTSAAATTADAASTGTSAATSTVSAPPATFPSGIYYSRPSPPGTEGPNTLVHVGKPLARTVALRPNGFDLTAQRAVSTDSESTLHFTTAGGVSSSLRVPGLHHMGRPSFSPPEMGKVAVQANESPDAIGGDQAGADFNVYVVDLATGAHERISPLGVNEESPEWIPGTPLVAYSSFDPASGVDLHVHDTAAGKEAARFHDIGGLHLAASPDGSLILEGKRLKLYDLATGNLVRDLLPAASTGLRDAGYEPDAAHDGANHQGSFPLDADFSPDGTRIVFDGAVTKGGAAGLLVMTMAVDGTGFEVVDGPVPADPARSNNHNYSQVNPVWL